MTDRWTQKHTKELVQMINTGELNPERTGKFYLEQAFNELPDDHILKGVGVEKFRTHFIDKARDWLVDQNLHADKSELCCICFPSQN